MFFLTRPASNEGWSYLFTTAPKASISRAIIPLLSLQDAEGFNAVHHVHSMVLELQAKHEKLTQTTAELVDEYNRREKSLEELYGSIDRLDQNKADKKHVSQEIGIKVSQIPIPLLSGRVLPYLGYLGICGPEVWFFFS